MKTKRIILACFSLLLAFSLSACGNTAQAPSDSGESQESMISSELVSDSEDSSSLLSESQVSESVQEEPLTAEEKTALEDLVKEISQLPIGTAGSSLISYEAFTHLANDFAFYADKTKEADQVLAQAAEKVESKDEFQNQLLMMTSTLEDMEEDLQDLQIRVKDAGVELHPSLKAEEIQGLLNAIIHGAGF